MRSTGENTEAEDRNIQNINIEGYIYISRHSLGPTQCLVHEKFSVNEHE